ncbi:MAG TPA: hypothetical protein VN924_01285 [Bryobacteraceae bacterium]|nr:hypothetical protein [Bryobacteraceae bacterium]
MRPLALITALSTLVLAPYTTAQAATFSTLYFFSGQNGDGSQPEGNMAVAKHGAIDGTTYEGGIVGSACPSGPLNLGGCGTVFRLTPPAAPEGAWTETVLYRFTGEDGDGAGPTAGVVIGLGGALYGTTHSGGSAGDGTGIQAGAACNT